jgi:hypothetical protein
MATRCLYCGQASTGLFKRSQNREFCSPEHRESYRERLLRVANELSAFEPAAVQPAGDAPAATAPPILLTLRSFIAAAARAIASPPVVCADCAVRLEHGPRAVSVPPAPRLSPPQFMALHVNPAPAPARVQPTAGPLEILTPKFENCVKIKGWGLRLSFSKAHAVVAREKASTHAQSGTSHT